jgi:hypothetical protein
LHPDHLVDKTAENTADNTATHTANNAVSSAANNTVNTKNHSANVIPLGTAKFRVASELLISSVLRLISQHGALAAMDTEAAIRSAETIERHLKTLAELPDMEPILCATCQQLSEQWGMLLEQQRPKSASSVFINRLISGPRQQRTN